MLQHTLYDTMKKTLDDLNLEYRETEDLLEAVCSFTSGEDIQELSLTIRPGAKMFRILSVLPGNFENDKQMEAVFACCEVNKVLGMGQFSYHPGYKKIVFTLASPFQNCQIESDWFTHQIVWAHIILTKYGKLFEWLGEGRISLEEFLEKIEKL